MSEFNQIINEFERALLSLDRAAVDKIILNAVKDKAPEMVASELITSALQRIGDGWENGTVALSQVYLSGIMCEEIIDKILPQAGPSRKNQPKMAIAVFEDYHLLGKRIIYSTLKASGFELIDLGGGQSVENLIKIVDEKEIKILLLSVLMLPSALKIKKLKEQLNGKDVKIIVGGAPFRFDNELMNEVGADAMGRDPGEAISILNNLIGGVK